MNRANRTLWAAAAIVALLATAGHAQGPQRGRGGAPPLVAKYKGAGSRDEAANFVCSAGFQ
jgi:hypothetical protein